MSRLEVGVSDVLPRWIVYLLLRPALKLTEQVQLICHDDKTERLLSRLMLNELDVVLTDMPAGPRVKLRAYNHLLGDCGVSFLASTKLANKFRRGFPKSLDQAPFLLPMEGTEQRIRRQFDVQVIGRAEAIREQYFAISTERKLKHPGVIAISEAARGQLFK